MARRLTSLGGTIVTGAEARSIVVRGGRAVAVRTADTEYSAERGGRRQRQRTDPVRQPSSSRRPAGSRALGDETLRLGSIDNQGGLGIVVAGAMGPGARCDTWDRAHRALGGRTGRVRRADQERNHRCSPIPARRSDDDDGFHSFPDWNRVALGIHTCAARDQGGRRGRRHRGTMGRRRPGADGGSDAGSTGALRARLRVSGDCSPRARSTRVRVQERQPARWRNQRRDGCAASGVGPAPDPWPRSSRDADHESVLGVVVGAPRRWGPRRGRIQRGTRSAGSRTDTDLGSRHVYRCVPPVDPTDRAEVCDPAGRNCGVRPLPEALPGAQSVPR